MVLSRCETRQVESKTKQVDLWSIGWVEGTAKRVEYIRKAVEQRATSKPTACMHVCVVCVRQRALCEAGVCEDGDEVRGDALHVRCASVAVLNKIAGVRCAGEARGWRGGFSTRSSHAQNICACAGEFVECDACAGVG